MRKNFPIGDDDFENLVVDDEIYPNYPVYFCGDSFYGYYSYEDFDKFIEDLNVAWKKAKEFIENEKCN